MPPDDWAILELAKPIGNQIGYIGWTRIDRSNIAQFHRDDLRFIQAVLAIKSLHGKDPVS